MPPLVHVPRPARARTSTIYAFGALYDFCSSPRRPPALPAAGAERLLAEIILYYVITVIIIVVAVIVILDCVCVCLMIILNAARGESTAADRRAGGRASGQQLTFVHSGQVLHECGRKADHCNYIVFRDFVHIGLQVGLCRLCWRVSLVCFAICIGQFVRGSPHTSSVSLVSLGFRARSLLCVWSDHEIADELNSN